MKIKPWDQLKDKPVVEVELWKSPHSVFRLSDGEIRRAFLKTMSPTDRQRWLESERANQEEYREHVFWTYAANSGFKKHDNEGEFVYTCPDCDEQLLRVIADDFSIYLEKIKNYAMAKHKTHHRKKHTILKRFTK